MADDKGIKKGKWSKIFLIDITDGDTSRKVFSFRGSKLRLIFMAAVLMVLILISCFAVVAYTPVRELIPGYPSSESRRLAIENAAMLDSLENAIALQDLLLTNIQRIVTGRKPFDVDSMFVQAPADSASPLDTSLLNRISRDDSLLRSEITSQEKYAISSRRDRVRQIEGMLFFPPVKGIITESYNEAIRHPFIDIAVPSNTIVNSVLDGTVISAFWTDDTGYNVQIQHLNNLISVYRHCSSLLVKTGDKVSAGAAIAISGDTGRLSRGSHLHFELWHQGEPVDPALYIKF